MNYLLKGLGVTALCILGRVALFFNPDHKTYSFKTIWNKDYDKGDEYWQFAEDFSQKAIGAVLLVLIGYLLVFLHHNTE
ncbi:hypothetical protein ACFQ3S_18025 [Mucilaginibacter terrae]|uniref:hypothetical protein n=1 Tax=Mucilaginibacter terrae TaxID=1955052 RepID=UPI003639405E